MSKAEIVESDNGEWHWRLKAGNSEVVAVGEQHTRQADALRALLDTQVAFLNLEQYIVVKADGTETRIDEPGETGQPDEGILDETKQEPL